MLYTIKNYDDLEKSNKLASLQSQVKALGVQDKPRKQNFHEDMKEVFDPVTKYMKDVSEGVTKTMAESSEENNKALEILNNKVLIIMNNTVILASYLLSLQSKITNP